MDKVKEKVEKIINEIGGRELEPNDIDMLGKLVDIHKDINEEEYWKEKIMRYNRDGYDDMSYGRRRRDSRGRYRGDDMLEEMREHYDTYNRGRSYGGRDTTESLEYMMQSAYEFICMLEEEANTDEEMNIIRKYARKISEL